MAAVLSPQTTSQSPSPSSLPSSSSTSPNRDLSALPPIVTSPPLKAQIGRVPSYSKHRLSTFSQKSTASSTQGQSRSRPLSTAFPFFPSSLPYTLVRDFAYPPYHPLHYGPPPEQPSGISTPASDAHRRLSDPVPAPWERSDMWDSWRQSGEQLPSTTFGDHDGPPWSEDEDLASPVVTTAKHRKNKSNMYAFDQTTRGRSRDREPRRSFMGTNGNGSETYYISDANEIANGPGGEFITYPPGASGLGIPASSNRRDSHFATSLARRANVVPFDDISSSPESQEEDDEEGFDPDESRYSRDYQFTIASPDEEMHGRAVALFDFARENDNELPLAEGQVILVSYRHGQGWLVAQDPRTGESGLVPEEYVRLLRDIEGGWNGLMNGAEGNGKESQEEDAQTPTQTEHKDMGLDIHKRDASDGKKEGAKDGAGPYYPPVVSTFSTSREDLEPWPHHLLGSQVHTPTSLSEFPRRGSEDSRSPARRSRSPVKKSLEISREDNDSTPLSERSADEGLVMKASGESHKAARDEGKPTSER